MSAANWAWSCIVRPWSSGPRAAGRRKNHCIKISRVDPGEQQLLSLLVKEVVGTSTIVDVHFFYVEADTPALHRSARYCAIEAFLEMPEKR